MAGDTVRLPDAMCCCQMDAKKATWLLQCNDLIQTNKPTQQSSMDDE